MSIREDEFVALCEFLGGKFSKTEGKGEFADGVFPMRIFKCSLKNGKLILQYTEIENVASYFSVSPDVKKASVSVRLAEPIDIEMVTEEGNKIAKVIGTGAVIKIERSKVMTDSISVSGPADVLIM